jgi:hypothetical protein
MRNPKGNEILKQLIKEVESTGISTDLITALQEARELAKSENDPLITRALRLLWQHLEANESFEVPLAEEIETATDNLIFFISLCVKSDNELNRDELRVMTQQLQELA